MRFATYFLKADKRFSKEERIFLKAVGVFLMVEGMLLKADVMFLKAEGMLLKTEIVFLMAKGICLTIDQHNKIVSERYRMGLKTRYGFFLVLSIHGLISCARRPTSLSLPSALAHAVSSSSRNTLKSQNLPPKISL